MRKLILTIYILLPFILLGLGYYLVTIPAGTILVGIKQEVLFGVGQSVIASALVSFVLLVGTWAEGIARSADEASLKKTLDEYLEKTNVLKELGVRKIHSDRYIRPVYIPYQNNVSRQLDLLGMSLSHFEQDLGEKLQEWVTRRPNLHMRLLVLNPTSPYCSERDAEEGSTPGDIANGSLRLTERVLALNHPRIELRWYSTIPTVNIYRMDNVMFLGNYLIARLSRLTATLELDVNGSLAEQYVKHFEDLWNPPAAHQWSMAPTQEDVNNARQQLSSSLATQ